MKHIKSRPMGKDDEGAFEEIILLGAADRLPFLATRIFQRINIEGGKVMNRPIIAMTASIDMFIANANKLSRGLAVGLFYTNENAHACCEERLNETIISGTLLGQRGLYIS